MPSDLWDDQEILDILSQHSHGNLRTLVDRPDLDGKFHWSMPVVGIHQKDNLWVASCAYEKTTSARLLYPKSVHKKYLKSWKTCGSFLKWKKKTATTHIPCFKLLVTCAFATNQVIISLADPFFFASMEKITPGFHRFRRGIWCWAAVSTK